MGRKTAKWPVAGLDIDARRIAGQAIVTGIGADAAGWPRALRA
ncbi:hypothetical protein OE766_25200 [Pararhizobium sp. YC-54]|nr:hypothetical protein [Pararhizobium sp. YC-54]MCW0001520.1 hypothetical protein [Pararhizobium sp. YC-54]